MMSFVKKILFITITPFLFSNSVQAKRTADFCLSENFHDMNPIYTEFSTEYEPEFLRKKSFNLRTFIKNHYGKIITGGVLFGMGAIILHQHRLINQCDQNIRIIEDRCEEAVRAIRKRVKKLENSALNNAPIPIPSLQYPQLSGSLYANDYRGGGNL